MRMEEERLFFFWRGATCCIMIAAMQIHALTLGKTNSLTVNYEDLNIWGHHKGVWGKTEAVNTKNKEVLTRSWPMKQDRAQP